jgi:Tol biopolymer transport system component
MIRRFQFVFSTWTSSNPFSECQSLAWTPSGDRILMTDSLGATTGTGLVAISTSTGEERVLTTPAGDDQDCFARLAPDGRCIAFVRMISHAVGFLYTLEIDGSHLTQITHDPLDLRVVAWLPDGRHVVFAAKQRGAYQLRVIALDGGESVALPSSTASASDPIVAHDGSYIAFVEGRRTGTSGVSLWKVTILEHRSAFSHPPGKIILPAIRRTARPSPSFRTGPATQRYGPATPTASSCDS